MNRGLLTTPQAKLYKRLFCPAFPTYYLEDFKFNSTSPAVPLRFSPSEFSSSLSGFCFSFLDAFHVILMVSRDGLFSRSSFHLSTFQSYFPLKKKRTYQYSWFKFLWILCWRKRSHLIIVHVHWCMSWDLEKASLFFLSLQVKCKSFDGKKQYAGNDINMCLTFIRCFWLYIFGGI